MQTAGGDLTTSGGLHRRPASSESPAGCQERAPHGAAGCRNRKRRRTGSDVIGPGRRQATATGIAVVVFAVVRRGRRHGRARHFRLASPQTGSGSESTRTAGPDVGGEGGRPENSVTSADVCDVTGVRQCHSSTFGLYMMMVLYIGDITFF